MATALQKRTSFLEPRLPLCGCSSGTCRTATPARQGQPLVAARRTKQVRKPVRQEMRLFADAAPSWYGTSINCLHLKCANIDRGIVYRMDEFRTRNIFVGGRRTSIRLEAVFWSAIEEIMAREDITLHALVTRIAFARGGGKNLSSSVRVFIQSYFFELAHQRALLLPQDLNGAPSEPGCYMPAPDAVQSRSRT